MVVPGSDKEGRMQCPDELRRENEALRDRIFELRAAILLTWSDLIVSVSMGPSSRTVSVGGELSSVKYVTAIQ